MPWTYNYVLNKMIHHINLLSYVIRSFHIHLLKSCCPKLLNTFYGRSSCNQIDNNTLKSITLVCMVQVICFIFDFFTYSSSCIGRQFFCYWVYIRIDVNALIITSFFIWWISSPTRDFFVYVVGIPEIPKDQIDYWVQNTYL